jgi:hypothetical protein
MPGGARKLVDNVTVPGDAKPREPVDDGVYCSLRGALAIGVLDPQQHLSATAACIEPVEQRRSRAADMQEARRGGGKPGDDGFGHCEGVIVLRRFLWRGPCTI